MSTATKFDISKYLGTWYELMHYPSWFQRNDNYNTQAEYSLNRDGTIKVVNSTITQGKRFESIGSAKQLSDMNFRVDFPMPEVNKLTNSGQFKPDQLTDSNVANYVIDRVWVNKLGSYIYAVVTDAKHDSLYVLSRFSNPDLAAYNEIMNYVVANYDRDRLVQTPHFK